MAITEPYYRTLCELRDSGLFFPGGSLLEIGEANWYGNFLPEGIDCSGNDQFEVAKRIYRATIQPRQIDAIDFGGTKNAKRHDLNLPYQSPTLYDVVINNGTAEHIANVPQVFKTMHDATMIGGLMIHDAPWLNWIDHGFYNFQPTWFYDLAHANNYRVELPSCFEIRSHEFVTEAKRIRFEDRESAIDVAKELTGNWNLFFVYRKLFAREFKVPIQGAYAGTVGTRGIAG